MRVSRELREITDLPSRINRSCFFARQSETRRRVSKYTKGSFRAYNGEPRWKARSWARQGETRPGQDAREGLALSLSLSLSSPSLPLSLSFFRVRGEVAPAVATAVSQPFRGYVTLKKLFGVNTPRSSDTCSTPWIPPFPRRAAAAHHPAVTRRQPSLPPSSPRAQAMTPLLSLPFPPFVLRAYSKCSLYSR